MIKAGPNTVAFATASPSRKGPGALVNAKMVNPFISFSLYGKSACAMTVLFSVLHILTVSTIGGFCWLMYTAERVWFVMYELSYVKWTIAVSAAGELTKSSEAKVLSFIVSMSGQDPGMTNRCMAVKAKSRTPVVRKGSSFGTLSWRIRKKASCSPSWPIMEVRPWIRKSSP